jgi:2-oxoglutarate ferredoxin oxidoreductase subunit delta
MAKGHIIIDEELCKGCRLCIAVCPSHLIQVAEYFNSKGYQPIMLVDAEQRCTGCALCAMMCPDAVITVVRQVPVQPVTSDADGHVAESQPKVTERGE